MLHNTGNFFGLISNNNGLNSPANKMHIINSNSQNQMNSSKTEIPVLITGHPQCLIVRLFTPLEGANVDLIPAGQITNLNVLKPHTKYVQSVHESKTMQQKNKLWLLGN